MLVEVLGNTIGQAPARSYVRELTSGIGDGDGDVHVHVAGHGHGHGHGESLKVWEICGILLRMS